MCSIMILGVGVMQQPAYRAARRNGWRSIAVDRDPNGPAVALADEFVQVDLADPEGVLRAAERYYNDGGLDGVFTAGTDFSSTVAYVAERLGLPGIPYETAVRATDKARMRECFRRAGVPSPRFEVVGRGDTDGSGPAQHGGRRPERRAERLADKLGLPFVVKPVDNMGARGVRMVEHPDQARAALESALQHSRSGRAIAEELIRGREYSIDALVYDGEVRITGVADRHIRFAPYFIEMGHTIPTELNGEALAELIDAFTRGVRALGITHGAGKGDVFFGPKGAMVGEIAARLSGGYMSGWTYPLCSGVELTEAGMRVALGLDPRPLLEPTVERVTAERAVISLPGRARRVEGFDGVRRLEGVAEVFQRTRSGERVLFPRNNVEKCGNVITVGDTRVEAVRRAASAIRAVTIELQPGDPETAAFLFGPETPAAHHAFSLEGYALKQRLAELPAVIGGAERLTARRVLSLPGIEHERGRDWRGQTPAETLAELQRLCGIEFIDPGDTAGSPAARHPTAAHPAAAHPAAGTAQPDSTPAGAFWRAFIVGGLQGARYLIDTIKECEYETIKQEILSRYRPLLG